MNFYAKKTAAYFGVTAVVIIMTITHLPLIQDRLGIRHFINQFIRNADAWIVLMVK